MKWESERQLCDAFRDWVAGRYMVHPECHEWDMILVDSSDRRIGVQAKIGDGAAVVAQCQEGLRKGNVGCSAVLVPGASESLRRLCRAVGIGVINPLADPDKDGLIQFRFTMPVIPAGQPVRYKKPLPITPSSLPAGVPSPRSIKDGEFMLEVIMHQRGGYLTNKDFQRVGWPERFHPKWLYKLKGRPRWEPTLTAVLPSQLDEKAYLAMKANMEAKGVVNV